MSAEKLTLVLHAALGSRKQMKDFFGEKDDYLYYEFPGHGSRSGEKGVYDLRNFAVEVLADERVRHTEKLEIFGYSMGGYVALLMALEAPEKVESITTLGTKYTWTPAIAQAETSKLNTSVIEAKVPAFANRLQQLHGEYWREVVDRTAHMMLKMGETPPLSDQLLSQIHCPVRVLRGSKDKMVSGEESKGMADVLPNGSYEELPGAPHAIEMFSESSRWLVFGNQ